MVYTPTFTIKITPDVGKYCTIQEKKHMFSDFFGWIVEVGLLLDRSTEVILFCVANNPTNAAYKNPSVEVQIFTSK